MTEIITPPNVDTYLRQLYDDGDAIRTEMEAMAQERGFPIIGPLCGRFLYQIARISGAKRIFELGSGYGYSALFFSRAAGEDGQVHCTELSANNIRQAQDFLSRAGLWDRSHLSSGRSNCGPKAGWRNLGYHLQRY